jgi:hypothetical protein
VCVKQLYLGRPSCKIKKPFDPLFHLQTMWNCWFKKHVYTPTLSRLLLQYILVYIVCSTWPPDCGYCGSTVPDHLCTVAVFSHGSWICRYCRGYRKDSAHNTNKVKQKSIRAWAVGESRVTISYNLQLVGKIILRLK